MMLRSKRSTFYWTIWLLFISRPVMSQSLDQLVFHELNQSSGLSELQTPYIFQDSRGFVWIGNYEGLNRFDGINNRVYRPVLLTKKTDPHISSRVFEDKTGTLWFSTYNGIHQMAPGSGQSREYSLPSMHGSKAEDYYAFHMDSNDCLWVLANDSLRILNTRTGRDSILHPLDTYVCQVVEDAQRKVIGLAVPTPDQNGGIDIIRYEQGKIIQKSYFRGDGGSKFPRAAISFLKVEGDSILWLPSDIGLIRFPWKHPEQYRIFSLKNAKKPVGFQDVELWHDHIIATSTENGLTVFDRQGNVISHKLGVRKDNGKADFRSLNNLLVTNRDDIWITSWKRGIYYTNLNHSKFFTLLSTEATQISSVRPVLDMATGPDDQLYCIVPDEGLHVFDKNLHVRRHTKSIVPINGPAPTGKMNRIFVDKQGWVWLQVKSNLYVSQNGLNHFRWVGKNLESQSEIIEISPDRFMVMTFTGIWEISKLNRSVVDFAKTSRMVELNRTYKFYWDHNKTLLVSDGFDKILIYRIEQQGIQKIKELNEVGYINGAVFDKSSSSWWMASNKGLFHVDNIDYKLIGIKADERFLSRSFNAVLADKGGNLWLSSNNGLYKFTPATGIVKHYTESDGLQGLQFMTGSACTFSDGRLAFGSINGLNVFHPDSIRDNPEPPILHFTDWVVNDTGSVSIDPEFLPPPVFSFDRRTLSFHFIGIDYTAPAEVRYRYRLAGFDNKIVEGGTNRFARYAQLPAGDYVFQVWAANSDGVWTTKPKELSFTILPPWYATRLARILEALLALGALLALIRYWVERGRRKERERRKEAEFRQREAESKQLAAELQNAVLRLQMNPHFIFNSMNSISSYILQKDIDTANDYLGRFARLMRLILKQASKPLITVADEIDLLQQYMATEAMRLEQKFTWDVEIKDELDADDILIPTMILQPFVENAIWHGISPKDSAGHIRTSFYKKQDSLICRVEDNGVGREMANRVADGKHTSKAIQITQQRLQMINGYTDLKISDLYDETGHACGTRVDITLPLNL